LLQKCVIPIARAALDHHLMSVLLACQGFTFKVILALTFALANYLKINSLAFAVQNALLPFTDHDKQTTL